MILLSVSLVTVASLSPRAQSGDVRAAIEAANVKFGTALGSKDAAALTALFTANATVMAPTAHEAGTYQVSAADGKVVDKGKYVVIWKRESGQWKMHRDIWNSDMPAAAM